MQAIIFHQKINKGIRHALPSAALEARLIGGTCRRCPQAECPQGRSLPRVCSLQLGPAQTSHGEALVELQGRRRTKGRTRLLDSVTLLLIALG